MRSAVTGSGAIHVALLVGMFATQTHAPRLVVGPDVIQVALLEPQAATTAAPAPAAAPAPPKPQVPDLKPEEGTGVRLAPPRPKRAPPETAKPPEPVPATLALASAPVGRAGLRGDVAVDATDFAFSYYLILLRNRVAQNWTPPAGLASGGQPIRAVIYFRVERDGAVRDARLESPSPVEYFDRSALRAIVLSDPMPPLPAGFTSPSLGVHFGFEYASP